MKAEDYAMQFYCVGSPHTPIVTAFCDGVKWATNINNKDDQLTKALRNCLGYARRELRRIERFGANGGDQWRDIISICESVGIKSSILRGENE